MNNFEIKNNESGRSMIEMLGVLAIIGVLSVGGIAGYSKAMQKNSVSFWRRRCFIKFHRVIA
ncbi:MAG: prepilin-type N-terminal cleavage/methylation domain-containing protein [Alphaproteobacteria bacterium]|nr:prepilin-type N-terminal cleavage/methylation domain-containing protein [Alphaproteobacteria bacterium]MBR3501671.1 prepilin-type N-terminal cleavage/methylation domain-containing protein [Alphaproteobacteria bacterium]